MVEKVYTVFASWDAEASYWIASSNDVPGLATGAATIEKLLAKLRVMVPELLKANDAWPDKSGAPREVPIDLVAKHSERVRLRA